MFRMRVAATLRTLSRTGINADKSIVKANQDLSVNTQIKRSRQFLLKNIAPCYKSASQVE
jgi:hypothetical protein